jgi:hypothetical protein
VKLKGDALDFLFVLLDCSQVGFAGFGHWAKLLFDFIVPLLSSGNVTDVEFVVQGDYGREDAENEV